MIYAWLSIVLGIALFIGGIYTVATISRRDSYNRTQFAVGGIAAIVFGLLLAIGCAFWLYGTEAGARAQKDWQSTTGGGLNRVVAVYDMEGDLIDRWEGKFDLEISDEKLKFDIPQANGSYVRVQVKSATGTWISEEVIETQ